MDDVTPLSLSALARRRDFTVGKANVRPSMRAIEGPNATVIVEPRVMQVLVALYDAQGGVVSREDLMQQCWAGALVGDDAINRAISEIRRALRSVGAEISIETIPRIGYRLDLGQEVAPGGSQKSAITGSSLDRRKIVGGGIAAAVLLAGGATFGVRQNRRAQVDALIEQGRHSQASGDKAALAQAEASFRSAIGISPERADAWGWLARVLSDPTLARNAATHALKLDAKEPNARTVLIVQRQDLDDWAEWEDALLGVLEDDHDNTLVLGTLSYFYQCVGRCKDAWETGERQFRLEPLNSDNQHPRAFRHWIFGKVAEADRIADQALSLWPRHPYIWNARLMIYAFTDRPAAALSLLDDISSRPVNLTQPSVDSWRAALNAIDTKSAADIEKAVDVCTRTAVLAPGLAANAVMVFSYLGELDAAYRVAEGLFTGRGHVVQRSRGEGIRDVYSEAAWARTPSLFIPATAAFRADNRFFDLCERMGHVAYWRTRRLWPDPFVRGSLTPG